MGALSQPALPAAVGNAREARCGEQVSSHRRLLGAVTALVNERGWRRITVARICRQAGLSSDTFHDVFPDAEECFAVTVEDTLDQLWTIVEAAAERASGNWADRVAVAVSTFLAALDADPGRAWLCVVEPLGDSRRAGHARTALKERLVSLLEDEDEAGGEPGPSSRTVAVGTIGSLWELALQHVTGHGDGLNLDDIAGSVTFLALAPRIGRLEAMQRVLTSPKPSELTVTWPGDGGRDAD